MSSIEDALRKIAEQTGSHCVSVSLYLKGQPHSKRFSAFLHEDGRCTHGMGASIDEAMEAAISERSFVRRAS